MGEFEYFEHTADVGITAIGRDLADAFEAAAVGLFNLMTDTELLQPSVSIDVAVDAEDLESLLVTWLNELIFLFDVENLLFKHFEITEISQTSLRARCYGERFDHQRHHLKTGVKAATHHRVRVEPLGDGFRAQVVVDV